MIFWGTFSKFLLLFTYLGDFCTDPKAIDQGTFAWEEPNVSVRFACFKGYHLVGPSKMDCRYGVWYPDTSSVYPSCSK